MHDVEDKERGEQAVAGGGAAGEDDVAGLLPTEGGARALHLFKDVLVPDGSTEHGDAGALECGFEAHVGHGGCDDDVVGQETASLEVAGGQQEDCVAIDDAAVLVGEEAAVGVSVEGDTKGRALLHHLGSDHLGIKRATVLVDIASCGRRVGNDDFARRDR